MIIIQESRCATVKLFSFISPAPLHLWAHSFSHEFITLFCCLHKTMVKLFMGRSVVVWPNNNENIFCNNGFELAEWTGMTEGEMHFTVVFIVP